MKRIHHLILLTVTLCILMSATACLGITDAEHESALLEQAQAAEQQSEVSEKALEEAKATATKMHAEIASLAEANTNMAGQLEDTKQAIQSLVTKSDTAKSQVDQLIIEAAEHRERTANAREESRWLWYEWTTENGDQIREITTFAVSQDKDSTNLFGLRPSCDGEDNFLYLVTDFTWDNETEYDIRVGFDGGRTRRETLWGYGDTIAVFADLYGDDLWKSETIQVGWPDQISGEATFDTAQLKRMFPTSEAFCNGDPPARY